MRASRFAALCGLGLLALAAQAQVQTEQAPIPLTAEQDARFRELLPDLRCLVCQNESLAESTAPLALDLKYEVRGLVAQGQSEAEIKKYLTDRYGDFVLFRPPFDPRTALLWLGPLLLAVIGVIALVLHVRGTRRRRTAPVPVDAAALRKLLDDEQA
ncbi:MAG: hypothetical protein NVS9B10_30540 [Nevskia sp.]